MTPMTARSSGLFISFEGIDGAGKSTHIAGLADAFRGQGLIVTLTREPGGTPLAEKLRAMVLGDAHALQLGIKVKQHKIAILFVTALLAGSITAYCGPIAFVGLAIPNLARALLKTQDHLLLILFSVLAGSCFLVAIDVLILLLDPWLSLPVNVLTAVIGAPYVAYLMLRQR